MPDKALRAEANEIISVVGTIVRNTRRNARISTDERRRRRQLVEDLPRLQTRLAAEGLREEQQPHGPRHPREVLAEARLVGS
jgi:hypothetical protein